MYEYIKNSVFSRLFSHSIHSFMMYAQFVCDFWHVNLKMLHARVNRRQHWEQTAPSNSADRPDACQQHWNASQCKDKWRERRKIKIEPYILIATHEMCPSRKFKQFSCIHLRTFDVQLFCWIDTMWFGNSNSMLEDIGAFADDNIYEMTARILMGK